VKRLLRALALALTLALLSPGMAGAADGCTDFLSGCVTTVRNGVGWYYSAQERAFFSTPAAFAGPTEPTFEYRYVPTCPANSPGSIGGVCAGALCTTSDGEPGVAFWQFSRPLGGGSGWSMQGTMCVPGERRVDLADVEAAARSIIESRFREIAEPTIEMAPQGSGLVNLPLLAWTDDPGEFRLDITQPLPGVISGTPQYEWVWSNGTTSQGAGRPYSPAVSPSEDPGYYVSSTYRQRGDAAVTLTVTWRGQVTVPGVQPVDIAPLVYTSSASLPVLEAKSVLVDAGS
jgi:hypothetical protein